jgi:hypothetical protein
MKLLDYPESDGIVVVLSDAPYDHSVALDEDRVVRYAASGDPIAVEFLGVSEGVNLNDIPKRREISDLLAKHHINELV